MRHDVSLRSTGAFGSWSLCSCGWESARYAGVLGASLAFATHLAAENAVAEEASDA